MNVTWEILDGLKSDDWLLDNLADFDMNGDGEFDYIFVYYRALTDGTPGNYLNGLGGGGRWGGVSWLVPEDSTIVVTSPDTTLSIVRDSGSILLPFSRDINGDLSEVRTVMGLGHALSLAAHEYGHDVWGGGHNDVGVGVMAGSTYRTGPGAPSWVERYLLDWVEPDEIDLTGANPTPFDTTITLKDSWTHGNDGFRIVRTTDPTQFFVLEVRDSTATPMLSRHPTSAPGCSGCDPDFEECQTDGQTSGLRIYHVVSTNSHPIENGGGPSEYQGLVNWATTTPHAPSVTLEFASGLFDSTTGEPDPIAGESPYHTRFPFQKYALEQDIGGIPALTSYEPGIRTVFSPYTNPSSSLYDHSEGSTSRDQATFSGLTFYNMHWVKAPADCKSSPSPV